MERGFYDNDNNKIDTDDSSDGRYMPSIINLDEFGYIETDSDDDSVLHHVDQTRRTRADDGSENNSKNEVNSNISWDMLPALIARNQPLDEPHDGDNKMDNNNEDDNNDNSFVDPLLVNIVINPPAPNLNNDNSYNSIVENSDASLPFNDVVGHENNPDTPREWDTIKQNKVSYGSDFEQWPPHALTDRQLQSQMNQVENNELDDYEIIRLIDNFEQRLQRLSKVLKIDRDLFVKNRNLETIIQDDGIEDFDKISKQQIGPSYFIRYIMTLTDYCVNVIFVEKLVMNQRRFQQG